MLKQFAQISINQTRNYAFKSHLTIKWIRPEKICCTNPIKSGDLEARPQILKDRTVFEFEKSKELEDADETVRKLCSTQLYPRNASNLLVRRDLLERVKRHKYDNSSMEVRIALMTGRIRCLQKHLEKGPLEKKGKVACKELIDKRKKFLKYLRKWDYKRFEWILERLSLVYKAPPNYFHWITRKESLVKLTNIHCEELKKKKMDEYKAKLVAQREKLLRELELDPMSDEEKNYILNRTIDESESVSIPEHPPVSSEKQI